MVLFILHHVELFHVTVQHVIGQNLILKRVPRVALRVPLLSMLEIL
jgi:hypothetical protein